MMVKGFASAGVAGEALALWKEIRSRIEENTEQVGEGEPLEPDEGLLESLLETCARAGCAH